MKNYKITIHVTKKDDTEVKELSFGGRTPDESFENMIELAFQLGRNPENERLAVMSVEEVAEANASETAAA